MADFIYRSDGSPAGFRLGEHIFAMDGLPLGRVFAEKAYRLDGEYVGIITNSMILDRPGMSRHRLRMTSSPDRADAASNAGSRLPVHEQYEDCFYLLEYEREEIGVSED